MDLINNSKYKIILGSSSSRRKQLLEMTGVNFSVKTINVKEDFPSKLIGKEISEYLVSKKNEPFKKIVSNDEIIITADTLVWFKNKCFGKPKDKSDAKEMLALFSGNTHSVITSVGFLTSKNFEILTESTEVSYKDLNKNEIDYYVETVNPIDKAGSYGIQDWIGMVGVEKIVGSYTSVLGLPIPQVINKVISMIENDG
jgi:septum formation protein